MFPPTNSVWELYGNRIQLECFCFGKFSFWVFVLCLLALLLLSWCFLSMQKDGSITVFPIINFHRLVNKWKFYAMRQFKPGNSDQLLPYCCPTQLAHVPQHFCFSLDQVCIAEQCSSFPFISATSSFVSKC